MKDISYVINFKIFDITVQWVEAHYNVVADVVENIRLLEVAGMDINQNDALCHNRCSFNSNGKIEKHSVEGRKTTNIQITKLMSIPTNKKNKLYLKYSLFGNRMSFRFHFIFPVVNFIP